MYGDLVVDLDGWREDAATRLEPGWYAGNREGVFDVLRDIRVEDFPFWYGSRWLEVDPPAEVASAAEALERMVQVLDYRVPQWQLAAAWWAFLAVDLGLPVADLAEALGRWHERFQSGIVHLTLYPEDPSHDPEVPAELVKHEAEAWWGHRSDLRHSHAIDHDGRPAPGLMAVEDVLAFPGPRPLPSSLQAWSPQHEAWMAEELRLEAAGGAP